MDDDFQKKIIDFDNSNDDLFRHQHSISSSLLVLPYNCKVVRQVRCMHKQTVRAVTFLCETGFT